jgi:hypothetical protein
MLHSSLALALCVVPSIAGFLPGGEPGAEQAPGQDRTDWRSFQVPSLCLEAAQVTPLPRLIAGTHLALPEDELDAAVSEGHAPSLALAALSGLLQEEARRRSWTLELHPTAPPLLARGAKASLEQLAQVLEDFDRCGATFAVELRAWVTPGASKTGTHPSAAAFQQAVGATAPWANARARSGEWTALGERRAHAFVANYSVEVATDSGVAAPVVAKLYYGRTLHVRACRARGGKSVHLQGFLDFAELAKVEPFDPGSPDLGVVQEPLVQSVQIAFSGVVASGDALAVSVAGAPLSAPDFTLWIAASTLPDVPNPPAAAAGRESAWRGLDLALLEGRIEGLPWVLPGNGLEAIVPPETPPTWIEPLGASALAQAGEGARANGATTRARPLIIWSNALVLAPLSEEAAWTEIDAQVSATEAVRLAGADVAVEHGALRVLAPATEGLPFRVLAGEESTLLHDYEIQIAPETWMPGPRVARTFDGTAVEGQLAAASLRGWGWIAGSEAPQELSRQELQLGRLQLARRSFRGTRIEIRAGEAGREALGAIEGSPALRLEVRRTP